MENTPQQMSREQFIVASTISGTSILIFIAHVVVPEKVVLDQGSLALLALAALPWFTLFFKKFKIPGVGEAETQDRVQGTTPKPLPPSPELQLTAAASPLSSDAKKVLATLWRYQSQIFGSDKSKRWTFAVSPAAVEYPQFLAGLNEAVNRGWVAVSPENHQCMLTNEGLEYVENDMAIQTQEDFYRF